MTAEVAILNKTAVALAADSAVTISAGSKEEKIFDSADKLFELSNSNAIGIMIFNGMNFMEIPLPSLVRQFRDGSTSFAKVETAASAFLDFLNKVGLNSPDKIKDRNIVSVVKPIISRIASRFIKKYQEQAFAPKAEVLSREAIEEILSKAISLYERIISMASDASFIGKPKTIVSQKTEDLIRGIIAEELPYSNDVQRQRILEIGKLALRKGPLSLGRTGIVIAGFGSDETFPTLVSFEIDGMVCDRLKYVRTNLVSIDHDGPKALVLPFAQIEIAERFLYGLDEDIQGQVTSFCRKSLPSIGTKYLST